MTSISRDDKNDLYLTAKNELAISTGIRACLEACEAKACAVLDEMLFFQDEGIPYFDALWGGRPSPFQIEVAIRKAILKVEHVVKIQDFQMGLINDDELAYVITIETDFGVGAISNGI